MDRGHVAWKGRAGKRLVAGMGQMTSFNKLWNSTLGLVIFVFLFLCFHLYAEEYADDAKTFTGQITIEKTSFSVNEEFRFSVFIPEISPSELILEEPQFHDAFLVSRGPSIRPGINGTIVDYSFKLNRAGRYTIESFSIKNKTTGRVMYTPAVFVTAASVSAAAPQRTGDINRTPPSVRWAIPEYNYYPGEIIPLCFVIENVDNPNLIIESRASQTTGGYVKRISMTSQSSERTIIPKQVIGREIYDVLFHDHIFVPFRPGSATLPDVEIYISEGNFDFRTTIKGIPVAISAPPAIEGNTGAIGNFSYEYEISGNTISDLQAVILKQRITGTGNFLGITMPVPYVMDPEIIDIDLISDIYNIAPAPDNSSGRRLFKGSRELTYSISKKKEIPFSEVKKVSVIVPDFSWHAPFSGNAGRGGALKQEKSLGAVLVLNLQEISLSAARSVPDAAGDKEKKIKKNLLDIFKIILIISIVSSLFFVLKKKVKKSIIAFLLITFFCVICFLLITNIIVKQPVYGIVSVGSGYANIYTIPEESAAVRFTLEYGKAVRIIGEKGQFYLIEVEDAGSRGWAKKENIILE